MLKHKKLIRVLIPVAVIGGLIGALILGACAPEAAPPPTPTPAGALPVPPGKLPTSEQHYYFLAANLGDPCYIQHLKALNDIAELLGVKTGMVGPVDLDVAAQLKIAEEIVAMPDTAGIVSYPWECGTFVKIIEDAMARGITMINGGLDWGRPRTAFVGSSSEQQCASMGLYSGQLLKGEGRVGCISINDPSSIVRATLYHEYVEENYPGITYVGEAYHDGSLDSAAAAIQAFVGTHPDLDALFFCDGQAGSLAKVMNEATPDVIYLGYGMSDISLDAVKTGLMTATIGQDTYPEEYYGCILLYYAYHGYTVPDSVIIRGPIIDINNVDEYLK